MVSFIVLMGLALTFGGMVNGSSHNITWNSEKEAAGKSRFSQCTSSNFVFKILHVLRSLAAYADPHMNPHMISTKS